MDEMLLWFQENLAILLQTGAIGSTLAAGYLYAKNVLLPRLLNLLIKKLMVVLANLFGSTVDGANPVVGQLPIIDEFKNLIVGWAKKQDEKSEELKNAAEVDYALRLLDMKAKLSSPLYSAIEKAPIQQAFDYLYDRVKSVLPVEIKKALEAYDSIGTAG